MAGGTRPSLKIVKVRRCDGGWRVAAALRALGLPFRMARLSIGLGVVLIVVGVSAYLGTGRSSITALIPAFLGAAFVALGFIALKPGARKVAMHIAVVVALAGIIGSLMRPLKAMFSDAGLTMNTAVIMQFITAGLCLVFLVLAIRSFAHARLGASPRA